MLSYDIGTKWNTTISEKDSLKKYFSKNIIDLIQIPFTIYYEILDITKHPDNLSQYDKITYKIDKTEMFANTPYTKQSIEIITMLRFDFEESL